MLSRSLSASPSTSLHVGRRTSFLRRPASNSDLMMSACRLDEGRSVTHSFRIERRRWISSRDRKLTSLGHGFLRRSRAGLVSRRPCAIANSRFAGTPAAPRPLSRRVGPRSWRHGPQATARRVRAEFPAEATARAESPGRAVAVDAPRAGTFFFVYHSGSGMNAGGLSAQPRPASLTGGRKRRFRDSALKDCGSGRASAGAVGHRFRICRRRGRA